MALHVLPRSLNYLETVARLGSIQAASRSIGIAASAIDRQIIAKRFNGSDAFGGCVRKTRGQHPDEPCFLRLQGRVRVRVDRGRERGQLAGVHAAGNGFDRASAFVDVRVGKLKLDEGPSDGAADAAVGA